MLRRWTIVFALLAVWTKTISLLPITEEININSENERHTRQLNFGDDCCRCPGAETSNPSDQLSDLVALPDSSSSAPALIHRTASEDCPCRLRDSDASASSLFDFPGKMFGTLEKPHEEPREDPKPLLHPEVGLASSVLQTLREATDEEYQEALARDAARSASRSINNLVSDPVVGAAKNMVTIILKPHPLPDSDDDIITSGTHFHESRCIHPLGSTKSSSMKIFPVDISKSNLLMEHNHVPFNDPLIARQTNALIDSDNTQAESNVQETVVEGPKIKTNKMKVKPSLIKLLSNKNAKNALSHIKHALETSDLRSSLKNSNLEDDPDGKNIKSKEVASKKNPDLSTSLLALNERINELNDVINKPLIPKVKGDDQKREGSSSSQTLSKNGLGTDSYSASRNDVVVGARNNDEESKIPDLMLKSGDDMLRLLLKPIASSNLFQLEDVEFIPKNIINDASENNKNVFPISSLKLPSFNEILDRAKENKLEPLQIKSLTDLLRNVWSSTKKPKADGLSKGEGTVDTTSEISGEPNKIQTEILDLVPNSSQNVEFISDARSVEVLEKNSNQFDTMINPENLVSETPIRDNDLQKNGIPETNIMENTLQTTNQQITDDSSEAIDPPSKNLIGQNFEDESSLMSNTSKFPENIHQDKSMQDVWNSCNQKKLSENIPETISTSSQLKSKEKSNLIKTLSLLKKPSTKMLDKLNKPAPLRAPPDTVQNIEIAETLVNTSIPDCDFQDIQPFSPTTSFDITDSTEAMGETKQNLDISVEDLQNMSDSLLNISGNHELQEQVSGEDHCTVKPDPETNSSEEDSKTQTSDKEAETNIIVNPGINFDLQNNFDNTDSTCENDFSEMAVGASNPVISTLKSKFPQNLLGSRLKEGLIVQPSSLIGGESTNIFNRPPSLITLNPQLPSLEELRERLSGLFRDINLGEMELEPNFNVKNENTFSSMDTSASDQVSKTNLSPFELPKEINLNLFELSPSKLRLNDPLKIQGVGPGLNINSLKARLQVPNLELKPSRLQSTFGKQNGLLGATFSVGLPPKNKLLASPILLSESLNLPSLDDMRSVLQFRAAELLRAPKPDANILRDNEPLRQLDNLRESLHLNAAKHANAIQETLSSSLNEAKVRTNTLLGTTLNAQPENVFDTLSRARFDVDDRLQEFHSTLTDHLASVHEMIKDPSSVTLGSPFMLKSNNKNSSGIKSLKQAQSVAETTKKPRKFTTLQNSAQPSYTSQGKFVTGKEKATKRQPYYRNNSPRTKLWNKKTKEKKTPTASTSNNQDISKNIPSVSVFSRPLTNGAPHSNTANNNMQKFIPNKSTFERTTKSALPIRKINVASIKPTPELLSKPQIYRKSIKSSPDSERFKHALRTTTVLPRLSAVTLTTNSPRDGISRFSQRATAHKPNNVAQKNPNILRMSKDPRIIKNYGKTRIQKTVNRPQPNFKSLKDPISLPSEQVLTKASPHFTLLKSPEYQMAKKERPQWLSKLKPTYKISMSKMDLPERTGTFKPISVDQKEDIGSLDKDILGAVDPIVQPEPQDFKRAVEEKSLLSKIKDSLRSRLSNMDLELPFKKEKLDTSRFKSDMMEGASDNLQNVVFPDDLMKEGISYKCKMVCTKDT